MTYTQLNVSKQTKLAMLASGKLGTSIFAGENWSDKRDNFVDDNLVLQGLHLTDTYNDVRRTSDIILTAFEKNGANTVRLPINGPTVTSDWWLSYRGAIDQALSKNMKVIICCWDSKASKNGQIDDLAGFYKMWAIVINKYGSKKNVYFEIFNEPAYSADVWMNIAAKWISTYPNIPKNRILVSGTPKVSADINLVGADSRFTGCLLALHFYRFFYYNLRAGTTKFKPNLQTVPQWEALLQTKIGPYANRTVITEFGDNMTPVDSLDYNGYPNNNIRIVAMQAITNKLHNLQMGSVIWAGYGQGGYDLNVISGGASAPNNPSALSQVRYGWGGAAPTPAFDSTSYYKIINVNTKNALQVSPDGPVNNTWLYQASYNKTNNQQWKIIGASNQCFKFINRLSGKVIDVTGSSGLPGASVITSINTGVDSQQWRIDDQKDGSYQISNRNSNMVLGTNSSFPQLPAEIIQSNVNSTLQNQRWQIVKL